MSSSPVAVGKKQILGQSLSERLNKYFSIKKEDILRPKPPPPIETICFSKELKISLTIIQAIV